MSQIGLRAKKIRLARGDTQEAVARRAGITLATYIRVEKRHNEPTVDTLARIAGALDVTVGELMGEKRVS
jgi:transcriptional regulator with XRE-family HTH domain